jgi:hypothetical protein
VEKSANFIEKTLERKNENNKNFVLNNTLHNQIQSKRQFDHKSKLLFQTVTFVDSKPDEGRAWNLNREVSEKFFLIHFYHCPE